MWVDYYWRLNSGIGNRIHHEATRATHSMLAGCLRFDNFLPVRLGSDFK